MSPGRGQLEGCGYKKGPRLQAEEGPHGERHLGQWLAGCLCGGAALGWAPCGSSQELCSWPGVPGQARGPEGQGLHVGTW